MRHYDSTIEEDEGDAEMSTIPYIIGHVIYYAGCLFFLWLGLQALRMLGCA